MARSRKRTAVAEIMSEEEEEDAGNKSPAEPPLKRQSTRRRSSLGAENEKPADHKSAAAKPGKKSSKRRTSSEGLKESSSSSNVPDSVLRSRLEELMVLRQTEPERVAASLRQKYEKLEAASTKLIESMRAELARTLSSTREADSLQARIRDAERENIELKNTILELQSEMEIMKSHANTPSERMTRTSVGSSSSSSSGARGREQRLLSFMTMFSGCSVDINEDGRVVCTCQSTQTKREMVFELNETMEGDLEYNPVRIYAGPPGLPSTVLVPEYLKSDMYLNVEEAPVLLHSILKVVFSREE